MVKRASVVAWLLTGSCVLYEKRGDDIAPACGSAGAARDGEGCYCTTDCRSDGHGGSCLDEYTTGIPGGLCDHKCASQLECGSGAACVEQSCLPVCTESRDCGPGRVCMDLPEVSVCWFLCDEDGECESGNCNRYSGRCLRAGDRPHGQGVAARCTRHEDCAGSMCLEGACISRCDVSGSSCPDGATCIAGMCLLPCLSHAECSGLGMSACADFGELGSFCSFAQ